MELKMETFKSFCLHKQSEVVTHFHASQDVSTRYFIITYALKWNIDH